MSIAIVTGASRGLGRDTALALARRGVDVIGTYRSSRSEADRLVTEIGAAGARAVALPLDVGDRESRAAFVEAIPAALSGLGRDRFDRLVNNAGIGVTAAFADTSEQEFDLMVDVHLKGVFFLTQQLLPLLADGGRIVNLGSGLDRFTLPGYAAYAAVKGGVEVLTRYLAKELGPRGITVNTVAPGPVATDFGGGAVRDIAEVNATLAGQTALGRVGEADDIGGVVAALLADDTRWVSGQRIEASGGMLL